MELDELAEAEDREDDDGVLYRLAATPDDYAEARALALSEGFDAASYVFPTVLALEDDVIVGALGTQPRPDMIVAGPLVTRKDRPRYWTTIRLVDAYESALRKLGMKSYIFYTAEPQIVSVVDRLWGLKPYAKRDGQSFFVKQLGAT